MKLTDTLAKILQENSINHVFGLQGGAVVHIFDSIEKKKSMPFECARKGRLNFCPIV